MLRTIYLFNWRKKTMSSSLFAYLQHVYLFYKSRPSVLVKTITKRMPDIRILQLGVHLQVCLNTLNVYQTYFWSLLLWQREIRLIKAIFQQIKYSQRYGCWVWVYCCDYELTQDLWYWDDNICLIQAFINPILLYEKTKVPVHKLLAIGQQFYRRLEVFLWWKSDLDEKWTYPFFLTTMSMDDLFECTCCEFWNGS